MAVLAAAVAFSLLQLYFLYISFAFCVQLVAGAADNYSFVDSFAAFQQRELALRVGLL